MAALASRREKFS